MYILFLRFGSSPRVWGAHNNAVQEEICNRFIPTCVGSAYVLFSKKGARSVHPHVCGERSWRSLQKPCDKPSYVYHGYSATTLAGLRTSKSPSKSTISLETLPAVRIKNPCSLFQL